MLSVREGAVLNYDWNQPHKAGPKRERRKGFLLPNLANQS